MGSSVVAGCHLYPIWRLAIEETVVIRTGEGLIEPHLPKVGTFTSIREVRALEDEKPCVDAGIAIDCCKYRITMFCCLAAFPTVGCRCCIRAYAAKHGRKAKF